MNGGKCWVSIISAAGGDDIRYTGVRLNNFSGSAMLTRLFYSFNQATFFYLNYQTFLLLQKGFQKELVARMLPPALPQGKRITEKRRLTRLPGLLIVN